MAPITDAVKAIVIKVAKMSAATKLVSFGFRSSSRRSRKRLWKKRGLEEGWLKVTKDTLAARMLAPGKPVSPSRSLLFIHGTFSNAAAAYRSLAESTFFDRVKETVR